MSKLPRTGIFCRSATLFVGRQYFVPIEFYEGRWTAGDALWWPVGIRWSPTMVFDPLTSLFGLYVWFRAFSDQNSAKQCISDAQSAFVLTSDRVFCAWHSNSCKVYPFPTLLAFTKLKSCPMRIAYQLHCLVRSRCLKRIARFCASHCILHCHAC